MPSGEVGVIPDGSWPDWQGLLDQGVLKDLHGLPEMIRSGDLRLSQLVIVQGRSDLAFDLFCNQVDPYRDMTTFLPADLESIRKDIDATCGKDHFNRAIQAYVAAAAEEHRRTVSRRMREGRTSLFASSSLGCTRTSHNKT